MKQLNGQRCLCGTHSTLDIVLHEERIGKLVEEAAQRVSKLSTQELRERLALFGGMRTYVRRKAI